MNNQDITQQFKDFAASLGYTLPDDLDTTGKISRFDIKKPGDKKGSYQFHSNGVPNGWFQDHTQGDVKHHWKADASQLPELSPEQREQQAAENEDKRQKKKLERAQQYDEGVKKAQFIAEKFENSPAPDDHPYLAKKGIKTHDALYNPETNHLVIPLKNINGEIRSVQFLWPEKDENGIDKILFKGCEKTGLFHPFANKQSPRLDTILIAEGFATCASLFEATGVSTIMAIDAGNLLPVAKIFREKFGKAAKIIICGDNDSLKTNAGQKAAIVAAEAVDGKVLIPTEPGHDWNDVIRNGGTINLDDAITPSAAKEQMDRGIRREARENVNDSNIHGAQLSERALKTLRAMNEKYTHAFVGGKNRVISYQTNQTSGLMFTFDPLEEFTKRFLHEPKILDKNPGRAWLEWSGKNRKLGGTGFYPNEKHCPKDVFNFYQGLRVKPVGGDCTIYLDHLKDIICDGETEAYEYLIRWIAHLFQHPEIKPSVSILLKSDEGAGKGTMVSPLLMILGAHGTQTNGAYAVTGRFNGIIANRLLIFADEVDLKDQKVAEKLKAIISEPSVQLERKGLELEPLPNLCRLIFASNRNYVINAGLRERRYLVLSVSNKRIGDTEYFEKFREWEQNGGCEALLHYLLTLDLTGFSPYKCPQTRALIDEKLNSLPLILQFLSDKIFSDKPFSGDARVFATPLINDFIRWLAEKNESMSLPAARSLVGSTLAKMGLIANGRSDVGSGKYYEIPNRETLIKAFMGLLGADSVPHDLLEPIGNGLPNEGSPADWYEN